MWFSFSLQRSTVHGACIVSRLNEKLEKQKTCWSYIDYDVILGTEIIEIAFEKPDQCLWLTCGVSRRPTLPGRYKVRNNLRDVKYFV